MAARYLLCRRIRSYRRARHAYLREARPHNDPDAHSSSSRSPNRRTGRSLASQSADEELSNYAVGDRANRRAARPRCVDSQVAMPAMSLVEGIVKFGSA